MIWPIFSFLNAFFESAKDVTSKHNLKNFDEYVIALSLSLFSLPFLLPLLFFFKIPHLGDKFYLALLIGGSLNVITSILYMKAIKHSDLSITSPMLTFTPLFLLITSPLLVGEFPKPLGLLGVLLIVFGSYVLNINQRHNGYIAPFKTLIKETGPKLMLIVAFIWSITSNFDKIGVQNSSPIFWSIAIRVFITLGLILITIILRPSGNLTKISRNFKVLLPIGLFAALSLIFQMTAISLALVTYVISIKRTSTLMNVVAGRLFFKEKGIKERFAGAALMIIGVLLITLSSVIKF